MSAALETPETKVLAIASHVVYGYVGNKMVTAVLQSLGCEVSALNTVQFSNHTGYKQFKGTRATATEILDLYTGLKQSHLTDFDILVSGYAPGAAAVEAVGTIAQDLKQTRPDLFWIMDPVMGDNGKLYVSEDVVPAYKTLLPFADLILPNQFEAEVLSGIKITDLPSLITAIQTLHSKYGIPHIIVTSVRFPFGDVPYPSPGASIPPTLSIIGSTIKTADAIPRLFRITVPDLDAYFSGTGDMFAALVAARFRESCLADGLCQNTIAGNPRSTWLCPDDVEPLSTPLARAAEKVCASMSTVLQKTKEKMDREMSRGGSEGSEMDIHLRRSKAAEVKVVRYQQELRDPPLMYRAEDVRL